MLISSMFMIIGVILSNDNDGYLMLLGIKNNVGINLIE